MILASTAALRLGGIPAGRLSRTSGGLGPPHRPRAQSEAVPRARDEACLRRSAAPSQAGLGAKTGLRDSCGEPYGSAHHRAAVRAPADTAVRTARARDEARPWARAGRNDCKARTGARTATRSSARSAATARHGDRQRGTGEPAGHHATPARRTDGNAAGRPGASAADARARASDSRRPGQVGRGALRAIRPARRPSAEHGPNCSRQLWRTRRTRATARRNTRGTHARADNAAARPRANTGPVEAAGFALRVAVAVVGRLRNLAGRRERLKPLLRQPPTGYADQGSRWWERY